MALCGCSTQPGSETVGSVPCVSSVSGTDERRQSRVESACCYIRSWWDLLLYSGEIGAADAERLARNARAPEASRITIQLFGVPDAFSNFLSLPTRR